MTGADPIPALVIFPRPVTPEGTLLWWAPGKLVPGVGGHLLLELGGSLFGSATAGAAFSLVPVEDATSAEIQWMIASGWRVFAGGDWLSLPRPVAESSN